MAYAIAIIIPGQKYPIPQGVEAQLQRVPRRRECFYFFVPVRVYDP